MKYYLLLTLLFGISANADVSCKIQTQNAFETGQSFDYIAIQIDKTDKEYYTPKNPKNLDRKFKYCKVLAHYFECKFKTILVAEHYRVINYYTGMEILIPEHKETAYHFNKSTYNTLYKCERQITKTIKDILSDD